MSIVHPVNKLANPDCQRTGSNFFRFCKDSYSKRPGFRDFEWRNFQNELGIETLDGTRRSNNITLLLNHRQPDVSWKRLVNERLIVEENLDGKILKRIVGIGVRVHANNKLWKNGRFRNDKIASVNTDYYFFPSVLPANIIAKYRRCAALVLKQRHAQATTGELTIRTLRTESRE